MLKATRVPDVMNPFGVFAGRVRQNGKWAGSRIRPAPSFYALVQFDTVVVPGMVDKGHDRTAKRVRAGRGADRASCGPMGRSAASV